MKRIIKNFVLKTITLIAVFAWLFSAMAFGSEPFYIPVLINVVSGVYLILFFYANQFYFWKWEHGRV